MHQRERSFVAESALAVAGLFVAACSGPQPAPERAWDHAPHFEPVEPLESEDLDGAFEADPSWLEDTDEVTESAEAAQPKAATEGSVAEPAPVIAAPVPVPEPRAVRPPCGTHTVELPPVTYVPAEQVLGAAVWGQGDCAMGAVDDLLVDMVTGSVVECLATPAAQEGSATVPAEPLALQGSTLTWTLSEQGLSARQEPPTLLPPPPSYEELFAERKPELLAGEVTQIDPMDPTSGLMVLRLRDDSNLMHRVLLCPKFFFDESGMALETGASVSVEGLATRDELGKLWIASRLRRGELDLRLRDAAGMAVWAVREASMTKTAPHDPLPEPVSVRSLLAAKVTTKDDQELPVRGFVFAPARGEVPFVLIAVDEVDYALEISELRPVDGVEGGWRIELTRAELAQKPILSPLGVLLHDDH